MVELPRPSTQPLQFRMIKLYLCDVLYCQISQLIFQNMPSFHGFRGQMQILDHQTLQSIDLIMTSFYLYEKIYIQIYYNYRV